MTDGPQMFLLMSIEKTSMTETIWLMRPVVVLQAYKQFDSQLLCYENKYSL